MHLLYARFFCKVLYDARHVGFAEPYTKLRNQGMIQADDGQKMCKSKGNVVTPDSVVERYGADSLRLYELFIAPFEQAVAWNDRGVQGCSRFLSRYWTLAVEVIAMTGTGGAQAAGGATAADAADGTAGLGDAARDVLRTLHKTVRKVTADMEDFRFNTAVAALMEAQNEFGDVWHERRGTLSAAQWREVVATFTLLLAPMTPHVAEEVWQRLGNDRLGARRRLAGLGRLAGRRRGRDRRRAGQRQTARPARGRRRRRQGRPYWRPPGDAEHGTLPRGQAGRQGDLRARQAGQLRRSLGAARDAAARRRRGGAGRARRDPSRPATSTAPTCSRPKTRDARCRFALMRGPARATVAQRSRRSAMGLSRRQLAVYAVLALFVAAIGVRYLLAGGEPAADAGLALGELSAGATSSPAAASPSPAAAAPLVVYVCGAVRSPGRLHLRARAPASPTSSTGRGGHRRGRAETINLAAVLTDGQQVVVPRRGETAAATAAGDPAAAATGSGGAAAAPAVPGALVNLNTATLAELDTLPGRRTVDGAEDPRLPHLQRRLQEHRRPQERLRHRRRALRRAQGSGDGLGGLRPSSLSRSASETGSSGRAPSRRQPCVLAGYVAGLCAALAIEPGPWWLAAAGLLGLAWAAGWLLWYPRRRDPADAAADLVAPYGGRIRRLAQRLAPMRGALALVPVLVLCGLTVGLWRLADVDRSALVASTGQTGVVVGEVLTLPDVSGDSAGVDLLVTSCLGRPCRRRCDCRSS